MYATSIYTLLTVIPASTQLHAFFRNACACVYYVTYAGTISLDGSFIAAYEIINNIAICSAPGVDPAYTVFGVAIISTSGLNVLGAGTDLQPASEQCITVMSKQLVPLITLLPSIYRSHAVIVVLAVHTHVLLQGLSHIKSTLMSDFLYILALC
jgi:hypothetical protein